MQRVMNLSRVNRCRVQQNLRFAYKDLRILPKVLNDIITEIKIQCPTVITDGTKPLRAFWTDYRDNYVNVIVTAHFQCKPTGTEFYETRQRCLFAILSAVEKNKIGFIETPQSSSVPQNE